MANPIRHQVRDPLDDYHPDWQTKIADPLDEYTPDWSKGQDPDPRLMSAVGIRQEETRNLQENQDKMRELLKRSDLKPEQRKRLEERIKQWEPEGFTRRVTDKRDPRENVVRGIAAGLGHAVTGGADLALSVANAPMQLAAKAWHAVAPGSSSIADKWAEPHGAPLSGLRGVAAEGAERISQTLDPQDGVGAVSDFAGQLAGGSKIYGTITEKVGQTLMAILPKGGKAYNIIASASTNPSRLGRLAGQAAISLPLDFMQAVTMEDATVKDKIKQFGISTALNAAFAAATPAHKVIEPPKISNVDLSVNPGMPPTSTTLDAIGEKYVQAQRVAAEKVALIDAKAQWIKDNPELAWKKLSPEEKKAIQEPVLMALRASESYPKSNKVSIEAAVPGPATSMPDPYSPEAITATKAKYQAKQGIVPTVTPEPMASPVDPVQAKLDELKARMASGEAKIIPPNFSVKSEPIGRTEVDPELLNAKERIKRGEDLSLLGTKKMLDLYNHPDAEVYFEGDNEEFQALKQKVEENYKRAVSNIPEAIHNLTQVYSEVVNQGPASVPNLAEIIATYKEAYPYAFREVDGKESGDFIPRTIRKLDAMLREAQPPDPQGAMDRLNEEIAQVAVPPEQQRLLERADALPRHEQLGAPLNSPNAKSFRHGTGVIEALQIIDNGLKPKSSIDVGSGLSEGSQVIFEFAGGKTEPYPAGEMASEGSAYNSDIEKKIKRVFFSVNDYILAEDAKLDYIKLRNRLDTNGYKDIPIEQVIYNDDKEVWEFGGVVSYKHDTPYGQKLAAMSDKALSKEWADWTGEENPQADALYLELSKRKMLDSSPDVTLYNGSSLNSPIEYTKLELTNAQKDNLSWAVQASNDMFQSGEAGIDWPHDAPVARIVNGEWEIATHPEVVSDLLYRIEEQLPSMIGKNEDAVSAANKIRSAETLGDKVRSIIQGKKSPAQIAAKAVEHPPIDNDTVVKRVSIDRMTKEGRAKYRDNSAWKDNQKDADTAHDVTVIGSDGIPQTAYIRGVRYGQGATGSEKMYSYRMEGDEKWTSGGSNLKETIAQIENLVRAKVNPSVADIAADALVPEINKANKELAHIRSLAAVASDPQVKQDLGVKAEEVKEKKAEVKANAKEQGVKLKENKRGEVTAEKVTKSAPEAKVNLALIPDEAKLEWFRRDINDMTVAELEAHGADIVARANSPELSPEHKEIYKARYLAAKERYVQLAKPTRKTGLMQANLIPELGGGLVGFVTGQGIGDTDEERGQNALKGLALGVAMGAGIRYVSNKVMMKKSHSLLPGEDEIQKYVKTQADVNEGDKPRPFLNKGEVIYSRGPRPFYAIEKLTKRAGAEFTAAINNPGILANKVGAWVTQADDFMFGRPSIEGPDGNRVWLTDVDNIAEIAHSVDGDTKTLGNLMAALATIEQHSKPDGKVTSPIPLDVAVTFAQNTPQKFHDAIPKARKLNLALIDIAVDAGMITPEARNEMAKQDWYASLERIFNLHTAPPAVGIKTSGMGAANPVKALGKGKSMRPVLNPYESLVSAIPRMLRAAERNKVKRSMEILYNANKKSFEGLMNPAPGSEVMKSPAFKSKVNEIKTTLNMQESDAIALMEMHTGKDIGSDANTMGVWGEGKLRHYRLDPYLAEAVRSLHPVELDMMWDWLGIPTKLARTGIVNNPLFILNQGFRDNYQAYLNSQNGFRFGIDWVQGWHNAMKNSTAYKEYLSGGGGNSMFAQREVLTAARRLKAVSTKGMTSEGSVPLVTLKQLKSMQFSEAYHTLMTPIAEAARVGEYLRTRGRGKSVADAVYAAKEVVGNFSQVAPAIRGLNRTVLFLNPALKALDQSTFASGMHPYRTPDVGRKTASARYLMKVFTSIVLPAVAFRLANDDDEGITEIRKSAGGSRYHYLRLPFGDLDKQKRKIIKIPKLQFEGQVFGTGVDAALDIWKDHDPEAFGSWLRSMRDDIALNLIPTMVTIPYSLVANTDLSSGTPIVGDMKEKLTPARWVGEKTSGSARIIGEAAASLSENMGDGAWKRMLSPAGIDFVVRSLGGTLATEFLKGIDVTAEWINKDYLAPAAEWPIIRGALTDYPTTHVASVQAFYRHANIIDSKAKTMNELGKTDVGSAMEFWKRNQGELAKVKMYSDARSKMADLRQAMEDIKRLPDDVASQEYKRKLLKQFAGNIIKEAQLVNHVVNSMESR